MRVLFVVLLIFSPPFLPARLLPLKKVLVIADDDLSASTCPARRSSQCLLYLANSTIPNGGVGIFTAEPLAVNDNIGFGDRVNPLIDLYWHSRTEFVNRDHPLFDYLWQAIGPVALESADASLGSVLLMVFGMDAAINCHMALVNTYSATIFHDTFEANLLHRSRDPGVGAFAPYLSGSTRVANPIPSGGELFKQYGDDWFLLRSNEFGLVPLSNDYGAADALIQKFKFLFPMVEDWSSLQDIHVDLWDLMADFPYESRVTNAIPKKYEDIVPAVEVDIWEPYVKKATRTGEDLKQTGRCLDNISHGPSTLKQAGRGAFSTTTFKAGSIITGSPLLHISNDRLFQTFENIQRDSMSGGKTDHVLIEESIGSYQTSLNYCWKHPQSTMLLCPYGAGVNFVNHNQSLANVKLEWAPHGHLGHDSSFLGLTFTDIFKSNKARLAFDWVALRDIQEGEELFLDYGDSWERAWQTHVATFEKMKREFLSSPQPSEEYRSAYALNREIDGNLIRTNLEQESEPYPGNVELHCHSRAMEFAWLEAASTKEKDYKWNTIEVGVPCQVLQRRNSSLSLSYDYDVAISNAQGFEQADNISLLTCGTVVSGIPRSGLKFFDKPYTTEFHLPGAFRHPMEIPDALFPTAWRNQPT